MTTLAADERGADRSWRGRRDSLGWLRPPRPTLLLGAAAAEAHVTGCEPVALAGLIVGSDMVWMLVLSTAPFSIMRSRAVVSRAEVGLLVSAYVGSLALLIRGG